MSDKNYIFSTDHLTRYQFPTHINDLVMDRSDAQFSEVFIVIIEPRKAPPVHKHDDTEQVFYVLEGSGILYIGKSSEESYKVKPGDVVRIPVGTWHSITADPEKKLKYLAIDCFGQNRNSEEPTWDAHVKVICKMQGWDFNGVKKESVE
jgi:mannose-6-phosphate isomerase-like protein (cupin superfamily)